MTPPNPKAGDVVSVRPLGAALTETNKSSFFKTDSLQVVRLVLPAGKEIAPHRSAGEATVQCLEGRVAFTVGETVRELTAGDLLYLPAGETHALRGIENASLLVSACYAKADRQRPKRADEQERKRHGEEKRGTFPIAGTATEDARLLAARPTTFRSARSICSTTRF